MLLNRIWIGLFLIAMCMGLGKLVFWHDFQIFDKMMRSLFDAAKDSFDLALMLTGALCLWLGVMQIGEKAGAIEKLSKLVSPLFSRLFPEIPKNHPAIGSMMMNFSANMLGLDNAATPVGLKAMQQLQELNPDKERASNAQIMFLVINTAGLTIIPVSILAYRSGANSANPSEVFLPILLTTFFATLIGLIYVAIRQKINLFDRVILLYLGSITVFLLALLSWFLYHPEDIPFFSNVIGNLLLFAVIISFILLGMRRKINVYETFVEGAKGGFQVAISIVPFLVAMLTAVAVFRASGALEALFDGIRYLLGLAGILTTNFLDALPVAFMKPFSGSGARSLMLDVFKTHGVDSFEAKLAATFQGSSDTTFYILAVYFGSVGIKNTRYAAAGGLIADIAGIIIAIFIAYLFYK